MLCFLRLQEKHIQQLKSAIRDKENPLKVSQTRLEARTHRPDVELCRDPPYHRLVEEVGQIQESLDLLNRKLNEAEGSHQVETHPSLLDPFCGEGAWSNVEVLVRFNET